MNEARQPSRSELPANEPASDLLRVLIALARHKMLLIVLPLASAIVAAGVSLVLTPTFTGTARVLPPQQSQSSAAMLLGQLGGLAGGLGGAMGMKNPGDMYLGMLRSRTIADRLIERFKLQERYEKSTMIETRLALTERTGLVLGKDGIITIDVDDTDPQIAADIANAYVEELEKMTEGLAITEASQRRVFFEKQLKTTKEQLANAEIAMKQTQERTGLIRLEEQGRAVIEAVATLRAQIAAKQVQLQSMSTFATERNSDYVRAQQELAALRGQLRKLETESRHGDSGILVPTGKVPESGLEYIRSLRELKYQETVFELLARQFELAKLDEAKDAAMIQVVDKAVPADRRTSPRRSLIVIAAFIAGLLVALLVVFVRETHAKARMADPQAMRELGGFLWRRSAAR